MPAAFVTLYEGNAITLSLPYDAPGMVVYPEAARWSVYQIAAIPDDPSAPTLLGSAIDGGVFPSAGTAGWFLTGDLSEKLLTIPTGAGAVGGTPYLVQFSPSTLGMSNGDSVVVQWYYLNVLAGDPPPDPDPEEPEEPPLVDRFRRFLRVDWSPALGSRLITRVRFKLGGPGATNAALAFDTGFAGDVPDPPDVVIPHIPLALDDQMHAIDLPIPQLARGIVFYPDYLLDADPDETSVVYPALTLSHLQVYETDNEGETPVPLPTVQRTRVGVQEVKIYPWNGSAGPYDVTTAGNLYALQSLDISKASTSAKLKGGESVHILGSYEVDRETKVKVSAAQTDLRTIALLLGGDLAVSTAGDGGEIQYISENLEDRAPYFRLAAKSTNGDGQDSLVFFKCRVEGSINFNLQREQITNLEFEFNVVFDKVAARQDGSIGGLIDWIFASKGEPTIHS